MTVLRKSAAEGLSRSALIFLLETAGCPEHRAWSDSGGFVSGRIFRAPRVALSGRAGRSRSGPARPQ